MHSASAGSSLLQTITVTSVLSKDKPELSNRTAPNYRGCSSQEEYTKRMRHYDSFRHELNRKTAEKKCETFKSILTPSCPNHKGDSRYKQTVFKEFSIDADDPEVQLERINRLLRENCAMGKAVEKSVNTDVKRKSSTNVYEKKNKKLIDTLQMVKTRLDKLGERLDQDEPDNGKRKYRTVKDFQTKCNKMTIDVLYKNMDMKDSVDVLEDSIFVPEEWRRKKVANGNKPPKTKRPEPLEVPPKPFNKEQLPQVIKEDNELDEETLDIVEVIEQLKQISTTSEPLSDSTASQTDIKEHGSEVSPSISKQDVSINTNSIRLQDMVWKSEYLKKQLNMTNNWEETLGAPFEIDPYVQQEKIRRIANYRIKTPIQ